MSQCEFMFLGYLLTLHMVQAYFSELLRTTVFQGEKFNELMKFEKNLISTVNFHTNHAKFYVFLQSVEKNVKQKYLKTLRPKHERNVCIDNFIDLAIVTPCP